MMEKYGSEAQQQEWIPKMLAGRHASVSAHRAAARLRRHMDGDHAVRDGDEWVINGEKYWNTGLHHATHDFIFARTSGSPGEGHGITCFIVPVDTPGFGVEEFMWTFNMPTDHAHVKLTASGSAMTTSSARRVEASRPPNCSCTRTDPPVASSLGAGLHCIDVAVEHVTNRTVFGKPLASNQAVQFPLAELATDAEMIRALIWKTAWEMDQGVDHLEITDKVAMCNYRGNRFCCDAADQAMQACGGYGYGRKYPFEHITATPALSHHRGHRGDPDPEGGGKLFGSGEDGLNERPPSSMVPLTRSDTVGIALAPGVGVGFARGDDRWSVATADPVALIAEAATLMPHGGCGGAARPRICLPVFRSTGVGTWRPCTGSCTARGRPRSV